MDSIKIIKKHGQPGGMPVATVYVDDDAPGESKDLYLHRFQNGEITPALSLSIVTNSETALGYQGLVTILQELGYTSTSNLCGLSNYSGFDNDDTFSLTGPKGYYVKDNFLHRKSFKLSLSITDNKIVGSQSETDIILPTTAIQERITKL